MLAKLTANNRITLPKDVVANFPDTSYFEVEIINGQIVLTPQRIQHADAVRAKLASKGGHHAGCRRCGSMGAPLIATYPRYCIAVPRTDQ